MKRILQFLCLTIVFAGCQQQSTKKQEPAIPTIPVVEVQQKDVPIYTDQVGQIYGLKDIPIRTRVDGVLEKIAFNEGTAVQKGDLLYVIDDDTYVAEVAAQESRVAEARTNMVNAKNELDRYKPLAEMNAVSKSDLDAAQATYDAAVSALNAAKSNLKQTQIKLSYCTIKAPIDGLIGKTEAKVGEYVGREPNPVILNTVSRIDTIRVQFAISEQRYLEIARAENANKTDAEASNDVEEGDLPNNIQLVLSDGTIYPLSGKLDFVDSQVNSTTGSILIQASFPNPSKILRPGLYAKVRIMVNKAKNALIIPQRCLIELQGKYSVLTVNEANKVTSTQVIVLDRIGDMAIIKEGLKKGDKVVIDALQKARPGAEVVPEITEFESKTAQ